ncbi:Fpg/Nei family DNA glycosylase [Roseiconus nitratireducens]|uniref:DNA-(apurinic or apyrimidinic site) lyase n=1 Tax=Roseiconus nitratireducens TaxID=2605748 RepID=A0A5M6D453_9BACT|nr:DNA-formamidopyrimidine glycosylase family protein [Roseiconus nitratireducens]KAA5541062.1 Fpg/Nei family DNA glycosylase [Roseiconus nitratireducens]
MPEGHKTHFLAREHTRQFSGQPIKVSSPQGRFRGDARKVSGKVFSHSEAVGKHLFYHFDGGRLIHVHLGRYGKFRQHAVPPPAAVGQVRMRWQGADTALDLTGPTTCRVIDADTRAEVIEKLGPDPLAGGSPAKVWNRVRKSNKPIGALLLDQAVVAGVGNIFRAELLFALRWDPRTPGDQLDRPAFDRMWKALGKMMRTGLRYGKIITVSSKEAGVPLASLEGRDRFRVYGKSNCPVCGHPIETIEVASRKLYWCPSCQS